MTRRIWLQSAEPMEAARSCLFRAPYYLGTHDTFNTLAMTTTLDLELPFDQKKVDCSSLSISNS